MKEWLITVFFPFLCVEEQGEENVAYLLEWKKEGCIAKGGKLCSWAGWVDPGVSRPFKCGRATMYGRPLITGVSVCGRLFMEFESAKKEKEKKYEKKEKNGMLEIEELYSTLREQSIWRHHSVQPRGRNRSYVAAIVHAEWHTFFHLHFRLFISTS